MVAIPTREARRLVRGTSFGVAVVVILATE
jgi:hypothetical protein